MIYSFCLILVWLSEWSQSKTAGTDESVRNLYMGVYGGLGVAQGNLIQFMN